MVSHSRRSLALALAVASLLPTALGFDYTIGVGKSEVTGLPGVGFDPSRTVTTGDADRLVFTFLQGDHQVVQSTFETPCAPLSGGFDSGLVTVPDGVTEGGPNFVFDVPSSTSVLYFYDAAGTNCQQGAVFCANTDEASATACFAYRAAAIALGPGITTTAASTTAASTAASTPATTSAQTTTRAGTTSAGTTAAPTQTRATGGAATLGVGMGVVLALVGGVALA